MVSHINSSQKSKKISDDRSWKNRGSGSKKTSAVGREKNSRILQKMRQLQCDDAMTTIEIHEPPRVFVPAANQVYLLLHLLIF